MQEKILPDITFKSTVANREQLIEILPDSMKEDFETCATYLEQYLVDSLRISFSEVDSRVSDIGVPEALQKILFDKIIANIKSHRPDSLKTLILNDLEIDRKNMKALMSALAHNTTLSHIGLDNSGLRDWMVDDLCELLVEGGNTTLTCIGLSNNEITYQGVGQLCQLLLAYPHIQEVSLENNPIGSNGYQKLVNLVQNENKQVIVGVDAADEDEEISNLIDMLQIEAQHRKIHNQSKGVVSESLPSSIDEVDPELEAALALSLAPMSLDLPKLPLLKDILSDEHIGRVRELMLSEKEPAVLKDLLLQSMEKKQPHVSISLWSRLVATCGETGLRELFSAKKDLEMLYQFFLFLKQGIGDSFVEMKEEETSFFRSLFHLFFLRSQGIEEKIEKSLNYERTFDIGAYLYSTISQSFGVKRYTYEEHYALVTEILTCGLELSDKKLLLPYYREAIIYQDISPGFLAQDPFKRQMFLYNWAHILFNKVVRPALDALGDNPNESACDELMQHSLHLFSIVNSMTAYQKQLIDRALFRFDKRTGSSINLATQILDAQIELANRVLSALQGAASVKLLLFMKATGLQLRALFLGYAEYFKSVCLRQEDCRQWLPLCEKMVQKVDHFEDLLVSIKNVEIKNGHQVNLPDLPIHLRIEDVVFFLKKAADALHSGIASGDFIASDKAELHSPFYIPQSWELPYPRYRLAKTMDIQDPNVQIIFNHEENRWIFYLGTTIVDTETHPVLQGFFAKFPSDFESMEASKHQETILPILVQYALSEQQKKVMSARMSEINNVPRYYWLDDVGMSLGREALMDHMHRQEDLSDLLLQNGYVPEVISLANDMGLIESSQNASQLSIDEISKIWREGEQLVPEDHVSTFFYNFGNHHWVAGLVAVRETQVMLLYIDGLKNQGSTLDLIATGDGQGIPKALLETMQKVYPGKSLVPMNCSHMVDEQIDGDSCGPRSVFYLRTMLLYLLKKIVPEVRTRTAPELFSAVHQLVEGYSQSQSTNGSIKARFDRFKLQQTGRANTVDGIDVHEQHRRELAVTVPARDLAQYFHKLKVEEGIDLIDPYLKNSVFNTPYEMKSVLLTLIKTPVGESQPFSLLLDMLNQMVNDPQIITQARHFYKDLFEGKEHRKRSLVETDITDDDTPPLHKRRLSLSGNSQNFWNTNQQLPFFLQQKLSVDMEKIDTFISGLAELTAKNAPLLVKELGSAEQYLFGRSPDVLTKKDIFTRYPAYQLDKGTPKSKTKICVGEGPLESNLLDLFLEWSRESVEAFPVIVSVGPPHEHQYPKWYPFIEGAQRLDVKEWFSYTMQVDVELPKDSTFAFYLVQPLQIAAVANAITTRVAMASPLTEQEMERLETPVMVMHIPKWYDAKEYQFNLSDIQLFRYLYTHLNSVFYHCSMGILRSVSLASAHKAFIENSAEALESDWVNIMLAIYDSHQQMKTRAGALVPLLGVQAMVLAKAAHKAPVLNPLLEAAPSYES